MMRRLWVRARVWLCLCELLSRLTLISINYWNFNLLGDSWYRYFIYLFPLAFRSYVQTHTLYTHIYIYMNYYGDIVIFFNLHLNIYLGTYFHIYVPFRVLSERNRPGGNVKASERRENLSWYRGTSSRSNLTIVLSSKYLPSIYKHFNETYVFHGRSTVVVDRNTKEEKATFLLPCIRDNFLWLFHITQLGYLATLLPRNVVLRYDT